MKKLLIASGLALSLVASSAFAHNHAPASASDGVVSSDGSAAHHAGNLSAVKVHADKVLKANKKAHLKDHKGNKKAAAAHVKAHGGDVMAAHSHDHKDGSNPAAEAGAHAEHHSGN